MIDTVQDQNNFKRVTCSTNGKDTDTKKKSMQHLPFTEYMRCVKPKWLLEAKTGYISSMTYLFNLSY